MCKIHFEFPDGSWIKNAFSYDFRVYTIPEVREALSMAGFRKTHIWWTETKLEHTDHSTDDVDSSSDSNETDCGDGVYEYQRVVDETKKIEGCPSWNCYIVACP